MNTEQLYRSIGGLEERLIEDSETSAKSNSLGRRGRLAACAACAALIAAVGLGYYGTHGQARGSAENDPDMLAWNNSQTESTQMSEAQPDDSQKAVPFGSDGPVKYSELQLADNPPDPEILENYAGAGATASLKEFEESMLANCAGIVEGVVTDIHIKTYTYQLAYDKFGEQGIINQTQKSLIYEISVDKTWYGEERSGQTLLIEDSLFFADEVFALKEGHRYVIPFEEAGETIYALPGYVGGDLMRDSIYSTLYEYHPQIEVTLDGYYLISKDWETLYAGDVREVVMDQEFSENSLGSYYRDRMGLITAEAFAERMNRLLEN